MIDAARAAAGALTGLIEVHRFEPAVRQAGDRITGLIPADGPPLRVLEEFVTFWKRALRDTDYLGGCPVVALAVGSRPDLPDAAHLVREIFVRWQEQLLRLLVADGVPEDRARRLATLLVAAVEGAVILCRAHRDAGPLDDVLTELAPLLGEG